MAISKIRDITLIASGSSIREYKRLCKFYGQGRWRKLKGIAEIKFSDGRIHLVELHWYQAHGIGKKEFKIKRILS